MKTMMFSIVLISNYKTVLRSNFYTWAMVHRILSEVTRWQNIGMRNALFFGRDFSKPNTCRIEHALGGPKKWCVTVTCSAISVLKQYCREAKMATKQAIVNQNRF